jgi:hypothetical protein
MFGLVFTLAVSVAPAMPSAMPAMPSASVTCPGSPASCDGAWGAGADAPDTATSIAAGIAAGIAADDGPHDYATPAEIDCPTPPEQLPVASGECSEPPLNLWYRVSRFPDSEQPPGSLAPAPRRMRDGHAVRSNGADDVGRLSAPHLQPLALFALPGLIPASVRNFADVSTRVIPARALAPPDRPPRV